MTSMAGAAAGGAADMRVRAAAIFQTLIDCFGTPTFRPGSDPTEELIGTILSANTTDVNSGRAFARLQQLGDWDAIRTAPLPAIIDAIRPAGMYNQKGPHIVATLEQLRSKRGGYDLSDLATMAVDEALAFLTSMPGVGQKTASIVLLFCFNRGVFPVDTHIQRITQRLGLCARVVPALTVDGCFVPEPSVIYDRCIPDDGQIVYGDSTQGAGKAVGKKLMG